MDNRATGKWNFSPSKIYGKLQLYFQKVNDMESFFLFNVNP